MTTRRYDESMRLYARASNTIPLASQTFSKSSINFVYGAAPLFLERGDGARVWDVDGNEYVDYVLGLLPVVLGYRDADVDEAIRTQLDRGITFSLATRLEFELAERLVQHIPCAEMVRFGKNGSDATTAAIRLARAHTGRERIAVCGYHGWHDWYIGTTSRNLGVPQAVRELSSTFPFNDADALETMLRADPDGFAAVILEPAGSVDPAPGFLERLRELTEKFGPLLVFDEIVTGYRVALGGAQAYYDITPDLACFGKSMGNGMPISAVVGRRCIMQKMESVFFSTTFGGEALSLAAAIATIDKLEATGAVELMKRQGDRLKRAIGDILYRKGLSAWYAVKGPAWRPYIAALDGDSRANIAASLWRQEVAANGLLMGSAINLCVAHHDEEVFAATLSACERASDAIASAYASSNPAGHLRGKPIQSIFQVRAE